MSNMLTDMYLKGGAKKSVSNEVAINISSDESDDDADMAQKTSERSEKGSQKTIFLLPTFTIFLSINQPHIRLQPQPQAK